MHLSAIKQRMDTKPKHQYQSTDLSWKWPMNYFCGGEERKSKYSLLLFCHLAVRGALDLSACAFKWFIPPTPPPPSLQKKWGEISISTPSHSTLLFLINETWFLSDSTQNHFTGKPRRQRWHQNWPQESHHPDLIIELNHRHKKGGGRE